MNDMVEKVARAMHAKDRVKMAASWVDTSEGDKWGYLTMARAAIEAMREPTKTMASLNLSEDDSSVWRAMINEALKEP